MKQWLICASVATTALASAISQPGLAQSVEPSAGAAGSPASSSAAPTDEIIVTGSRIRHSAFDQPSPVTFVDATDIARTGLSSIADVLQRLPSSGGGLNTKNNSSASGVPGSVDLNSIPQSASKCCRTEPPPSTGPTPSQAL